MVPHDWRGKGIKLGRWTSQNASGRATLSYPPNKSPNPITLGA